MTNALNWFEIFVADLDRATRFYEEVLSLSLRREDDGGMSIFPYEGPEGVGGALVQKPGLAGRQGALIYLPAEGQLDACLGRVAGAGGSVITPRLGIGPHGFVAVVRDSEGNHVGLHSHA